MKSCALLHRSVKICIVVNNNFLSNLRSGAISNFTPGDF